MVKGPTRLPRRICIPVALHEHLRPIPVAPTHVAYYVFVANSHSPSRRALACSATPCAVGMTPNDCMRKVYETRVFAPSILVKRRCSFTAMHMPLILLCVSVDRAAPTYHSYYYYAQHSTEMSSNRQRNSCDLITRGHKQDEPRPSCRESKSAPPLSTFSGTCTRIWQRFREYARIYIYRLMLLCFSRLMWPT